MDDEARLPQRKSSNRRSLTAQIILGFLVTVVLTAVAAGIPALWLIRQELNHQILTQIDQGQRAAQALYTAKQNELASLARLISERPSLYQLLASGERTALIDYLTTLQSGADLDLIVLCSEARRVMAQSGSGVPDEICREREPESFYTQTGGEGLQVWMIGTQPREGETGPVGGVIVGVRMDQAFVDQMRDQTGLDHTLLVNGQPLLTSFAAGTGELAAASKRPLPTSLANPLPCSTYELNCLPYYAGRLSLSGNELQAEVALEVSDIQAAQKRLGWILAGSTLGVAALGSVLGVYLARRISRPLVKLADSAANFSKGDLETPVSVETNVREEEMLAQALESARVDLRHTVTDLRKEKTWVNQLLESISEGIVTLDGQMHITFFSHGAEKITGWNREQVLNQHCDDIFKVVEADVPFSQVIPSLGQKNKICVEVAGEHQVTLAITGARFTPSEASEAQLALVFRDISEEETIHRLLGHFMANVAHEFRTPLSALAASIELLLDKSYTISPAELEELLTSIHLGILSLQTLVDNLLESASIEAGHFRVSPRPYNLGELVEEATRTMQPLLEKYGQQLVVDVQQDIPLVQADPRRTIQVLVNLLSNASRYGPDDAEIVLYAHHKNGWIKVEVTDQGPGIPLEYQNGLFQRFLYPASSKQTMKVGAGLGLSVVKAVIEAQGGQVGVDSRRGGGSTFWFTLPIAGVR